METLFILLILFQLKHFICDYPLQNSYMLGKFKLEGWLFPLLSHTVVHFLGTALITYMFTLDIIFTLLLSCLDLIIHFIVDRIKAHPSLGGRYKPENPKFWWCLGLDQSMHHLTHYFLIFLILTKTGSYL